MLIKKFSVFLNAMVDFSKTEQGASDRQQQKNVPKTLINLFLNILVDIQ